MHCSPIQETKALGDPPVSANLAEAAAQSCRDYVTLSRRLFNALHDPDGFPAGSHSAQARIALMQAIVGGMDDQLDAVCAACISRVVGASLRALGSQGQSSRFRPEEIYYYPRVIQAYLSIFLFWIWRRRLPLADRDLSELVEAVFEGAIGYRLIDVHLDHRGLGAEAVVLGMYLIRWHELRLARIFGSDQSLPIVKEYADLYASAEYAEKSNRWKSCPFSWNDANRLGWKAAPLFAILRLILEKAETPKAKIGETIGGLCSIAAAVQMMDDFGDASEDLAEGFETLVASGFYDSMGTADISPAKASSFLEPPRIRMFVRTTLDLIDSAIAAFQRMDEPILELLAEHKKHQFLERCNCACASTHP